MARLSRDLAATSPVRSRRSVARSSGSRSAIESSDRRSGRTVNQPAQGAFQHHTIVLDHMAAPIPNEHCLR